MFTRVTKVAVIVGGVVGAFCGLIDGTPGDGTVSALAGLPTNTYCLVVGANGSGESAYGMGVLGPIPSTLDSCP